MKKRKVLFLIESMGGGGAEKVLYTIIKNIDREKFEITLCCVNDSGVYLEELKNIVRYVPLIKRQKSGRWIDRIRYLVNFKLVYSWLPLSWVYRFFVPKGNDVEVAFVEGFSTKLLSFSLNVSSKKFAWVHTDLMNNHWIKSIYSDFASERSSYLKFDRIIGVSKVVSDAVRMLYGIEKVSTLYNPINSNQIKNLSKESVDDELFRWDGLIIVSVGRFVETKRFDRLIRILSRLKQEGIHAKLALLGEGPKFWAIQKLSKELGVYDDVKYFGFRSNPYKYMSRCDLFVCSSQAEGYSTAVTEACILGLPIVTTNCSGMSEILNDGRYGVITENDTDSLYEGVKTFLTNPDFLRLYKRSSQKRGQDFSIDALMPQVESLLF